MQLSAYGSVQEGKLPKRACYAVVVRDEACVVARGCELRQVSEAAVLVANQGRVQLERVEIRDAPAALIAGQRRGRALELRATTVRASVRRLWADADRPRAFVWGEGSVREGADVDAVFGEGAAEGNVYEDIVPRGAEEESDNSTESLDEQEFADMERLMEELDAQALSAAAGGS